MTHGSVDYRVSYVMSSSIKALAEVATIFSDVFVTVSTMNICMALHTTPSHSPHRRSTGASRTWYACQLTTVTGATVTLLT